MSATVKVFGRVGNYLNLESEDKKQYKEKSTIPNSEVLPDANVSTSLLLFCP